MMEFCKAKTSTWITDGLEKTKGNDEQGRKYGVEVGVKMCQQMMDKGIRFIHFYTMNLEKSCAEIIKGLDILDTTRMLPWKKPSKEGRKEEEVRPIFWANNPDSYVARTAKWDEFPNGRWGLSRSPAFGDVDNYFSMSKSLSFNMDERKKLWGAEIKSFENVGDLFISYLSGKIQKYPFSEIMLAAETSLINDTLLKLNKNKMYTINSQPVVKGVPSTDPVHGWGTGKGFVFQKAYIEFFVHPALMQPLKEHLEKDEMITYQAVNMKGEQIKNVEDDAVNAVTWGIFKGSEIIQPTVVDHDAFLIWKEEAFSNWIDIWGIIYGAESDCYKFLEKI